MNYRILFLGYWNIDDGLTHSTIFPHLNILKDFVNVEYLHFSNTQREKTSKESLNKIHNLDVKYTPLYSKNLPINQLNKIYDFIHFPRLIQKLCTKHDINLIIARGAPAGALAYLSTKGNKIPFLVESYEPHANYMRAAGEWKMWDLRYIFQNYWEKKQKKYAKALITVSNNYKQKLGDEGVILDKIFTVPCAVDTNVFYKSDELGSKVRAELNIPHDSKVGIYVGKFGGLYLEDEAFKIFKEAFNQIENFHLILLSTTNHCWIKSKIEAYQLPSNRIKIKLVSYNMVNKYLNASDFAFALYKSTKVSPYLSPVKIGEYWACGLPVMITPHLGDESKWIEREGLGLIIKRKNVLYKDLEKYLSDDIKRKGLKYRSLDKVRTEYFKIIK